MPLLAIPFPHIDPVAIAVGPFAIRWYALSYVAGIVLGWWYSRRLAANAALWGDTRRPTQTDMDDQIVWIALGIVLGGRLGYVLFYNLASYLEHPAEILTVWRGGMSFHGGLIGAILAIVLFARARKLNALAMLDVAATVAPIGLFTGRVANFINGELWGRASDVPWAMVFPGDRLQIPRHPSQLYQAGMEGILLFTLLIILWCIPANRRRPGFFLGVMAAGYGVARIVGEFFREPDANLGFLFAGATMGQLLSLPMLLVGAFLIWRSRRPA